MRARLFLVAATLVAFGGSLGSGFHFDDYAIFDHPSLTHLLTLRETRPLTYLTFWLNYAAGGANPIGYHAVNLALHLAAVLLAYACFRRLLPETAALASAAIFALHPIQAEAVDYIWARSIVLATLLSLASLREWIEGRPWRAAAWFAAALLAKEEVAAFPLALAVLEGRGKWNRDRKAAIGLMLALSVAAGLRTAYVTMVTPGLPAGLAAGISPGRYFLAEGTVLLRYLRLLLLPYGFTVDPDIPVGPLWLGAAAWAAVAMLAILAWRRSRWALAGLLLLIPSSTLFPAADLAADRRLYLPLFALAAAAGIALTRLDRGRARIPLAVACLLVVVSFTRTQVWMTDRSLWSEAVARAPRKIRPKLQLARALPAGQALELLAQAKELAPYDPAIPAETGRILLGEGQPDAAIQEFGRALALAPGNPRYLNNRGVALEELGQTDAARADFERALQLDPALDEARENLAKIGGGGLR